MKIKSPQPLTINVFREAQSVCKCVDFPDVSLVLGYSGQRYIPLVVLEV
jgi:hypothetical protein